LRHRCLFFVAVCLAVMGLTQCGGGAGTSGPPDPGPSPAPPVVDAQVVSWLKGQLRPLATVEAGAAEGDLAPFDEAVGSAHLVGLGEASHGNHEFQTMKHRLLQYLVEKKGFRVFIIEANMANCLPIQDYVLNGVGDAHQVVGGQIRFTCVSDEVVAMVQWMRAWNQSHADPADKVWYMGMDMNDTRQCFPAIQAYVQPLDVTLATQLDGWFTEFRTQTASLDMDAYAKLPAADRALMRVQLQQAYDTLESHRSDFTARSSALAFEQALRLAKLLLQEEAMYSVSLADGSPIRDAAMAENTQWCMSQRGTGTRAVVWAHDFHVSRTPTCMGDVLSQAMGSEYRALGFSFYQGRLIAVGPSGLWAWPVPPLIVNSYEAGFHQTGTPIFFLNLHPADAGVGPTWLQGPLWKREVGAAWTPSNADLYAIKTPLTQLYDMLIHVDTVTPSAYYR
jgi:erythromycin esterase